MREKHTITEASRHLPALIDQVTEGKTVELTLDGEPVAVLLSHRNFEELTSVRDSFADAYWQFAETYKLHELAIDPDDLFSGVRDPSPGRVASI